MRELLEAWKGKLKALYFSKGRRERTALFVTAAAVSHRGRVRENNEDNLYFGGRILPLFHGGTGEIWTLPAGEALTAAVFDGMGGEAAGELASYAAARQMKELLERGASREGQKRAMSGEEGGQERHFSSPGGITALCAGLNRQVVEAARREKYRQIGTTAVLAFVRDGEYLIGNLGDSPAYLFRDGKLSLLTLAHTNERLLRAQGITDRKPGLTQFLGIAEEELLLEPYIIQGELQPDDWLLLCSDGLTDMVQEQELAAILREEQEARPCLERLLAAALEGGGRDNITMILGRIHKGGDRSHG